MLRRIGCGLRGHAVTLQLDSTRVTRRSDPARVYLRCVHCGRESTGWLLDTPTPVVRRQRILRFKRRLSA
jgi:hypothetical protein